MSNFLVLSVFQVVYKRRQGGNDYLLAQEDVKRHKGNGYSHKHCGAPVFNYHFWINRQQIAWFLLSVIVRKSLMHSPMEN